MNITPEQFIIIFGLFCESLCSDGAGSCYTEPFAEMIEANACLKAFFREWYPASHFDIGEHTYSYKYILKPLLD